MREELIAILKTFGFPVRRQGSFGEKEKYPDHFFTIWNAETEDASHYDNKPVATIWDFDVNFYSVSPSMAEAVIRETAGKLRENGWIVSGKGRDVASDEPTHVGKGVVALYRQTEITKHKETVVVPDVEFELAINENEPERFSHLETRLR